MWIRKKFRHLKLWWYLITCPQVCSLWLSALQSWTWTVWRTTLMCGGVSHVTTPPCSAVRPCGIPTPMWYCPLLPWCHSDNSNTTGRRGSGRRKNVRTDAQIEIKAGLVLAVKRIYSHTLLPFSLGPSERCFSPCQYLSQSDRRIHCSQTFCLDAWAAYHHRHLADLSQSGRRPPSQVPHRPTRSEVGINHTQNNKNMITAAPRSL